MLDTIIQLTIAGGMIVFCLAIMIPIINIFLGRDEATRLQRIDREVYEAKAKARARRSGNGSADPRGYRGNRNSDNT